MSFFKRLANVYTFGYEEDKERRREERRALERRKNLYEKSLEERAEHIRSGKIKSPVSFHEGGSGINDRVMQSLFSKPMSMFQPKFDMSVYGEGQMDPRAIQFVSDILQKAMLGRY